MTKKYTVKASKNTNNNHNKVTASAYNFDAIRLNTLEDALEEADDANAALIDAIIKLENATEDGYLISKAESLYNKLIDFSVTLSSAMEELY